MRENYCDRRLGPSELTNNNSNNNKVCVYGDVESLTSSFDECRIVADGH